MPTSQGHARSPAEPAHASYKPLPAIKRAEQAIAASPDKSDRAIAEEIGVGSNTVRRARQKATAPCGAVEKRTGKDGKARKMP
jgi:hypothetical protein